MSLHRYRILGCAAFAWLLAGCGPSQPKVVTPAQLPQATAPPVPAPSTPPPAPAAPVQGAQQGRVKQLIDQVEKAYKAGDADYRRGRLVEAKTEFDHAVDLMLTSGIDI